MEIVSVYRQTQLQLANFNTFTSGLLSVPIPNGILRAGPELWAAALQAFSEDRLLFRAVDGVLQIKSQPGEGNGGFSASLPQFQPFLGHTSGGVTSNEADWTAFPMAIRGYWQGDARRYWGGHVSTKLLTQQGPSGTTRMVGESREHASSVSLWVARNDPDWRGKVREIYNLARHWAAGEVFVSQRDGEWQHYTIDAGWACEPEQLDEKTVALEVPLCEHA